MNGRDNIWMASEGLQVDFGESITKPKISVSYGELFGEFVSLDAKNMKLTFKTSDVELSLSYIHKSPTEAIITFGDFLHKLQWNDHNYSIRKISDFNLLVTVEENNG